MATPVQAEGDSEACAPPPCPHRPSARVPQALGQHCAVAAVAGNEPPRGARLLRGPELACRLLSENADDSTRDAAQLLLTVTLWTSLTGTALVDQFFKFTI